MSFRYVPIGAVFNIKNGATPASGNEDYWDGDVAWVTPADLGKLGSREIERGLRNISTGGYASCGTQMVRPGAVILSIRAPIGHMAIATQPLCFNQGCRGLEPRSPIRSDFAYWALNAVRPELEASGQGTTFIELARSKLRTVKIPLPDRETQRAIADFLDCETARIDQLVEKKQALEAALKQKTTDIADLLVTGAQDPTRQRTRVDSPWLSEIPTDWQLIRAKFLFEEMKRPVEEDDEVITAFRDGQVCLRSRRRTEGYTFAELEVGYQHICKGDLVIHTMDAFAGAIGVSEDDGKSTGEYAVCRPQSEDVIPEYYAYALRCMARRNYIFVLCPSVRERAPRFRFVRFAPVFLPVPPRDEQLAIVSRIENETAQLRAVQDKTIESIDRLREYRAALITAAVTGQIDVSEHTRKGDTDRRLDAIEAEMRA